MNQRENTASLKLDQNELQVMELIVAGNSFGIDITNIRELTRYHGVQRLPHCHPSVEGIIHLRDQAITVVDLAKYLDFSASNDPEHDLLIITQFSQMNIAFHVHRIEDIIQISRDAVEKPSTAVYGGKDGIVIGIAHLGDRIIPIIDFDWIVSEISASESVETYTGESEE